MRIENVNYSEGNLKFEVVGEGDEKEYELIRVADLIYGFTRRKLKMFRPYAIMINGVGGQNITSGSDLFAETVVDIIYKLTRYDFKPMNEGLNRFSQTVNDTKITIGVLGDLLRQAGIDNNMPSDDSTVLVHSLIDSVSLDILFDYIPYEETSTEEVLLRNGVEPGRYYPCFVTSTYGLKYKVVENVLFADMDVFICDAKEVISAAVNEIISILQKLVP